MSPKRQTGVLLDSKTDQNLFVCTASKGIRNVKISLRAVWNQEFGLCMAGWLNFDGDNNRNSLLLLNQDLDILEISQFASKFFDRNSNAIDYGPNIYEFL